MSVGEKLPEMEVVLATANEPDMQPLSALFGGKKAVLFAVPGAYTPTCHANHMPGFIAEFDAIKAKGVAEIVCLSVNDVFVMKRWGQDTGALGKIHLIADGSAALTKALGLELDLTARGLGVRSTRYAMILDDGVVKELMVEESPGQAEASSAASVLAKL
ncbi:MAG: peroxiredoxin [Rhodobacteraceae bacterium]|nr:peroxiredoxin [Paracoccaceae bacterium]